MAGFPGPGPVFAIEWRTHSRQWQPYATRALFVTALLVALWTIRGTSNVPYLTINQRQALLARNASIAIIGTQLVLVLLVAPAATAGAVCIDRARGTLTHLLVTDLTDSEIILGKLAARLLPVFSFLGCTLPVVSLCTLLGGIDPVALAGAYAITAGVAVLGCALALTLSVWARKTHEVLLSTYLIWAIWLLLGPMIGQLNAMAGSPVSASAGVADLDPFQLALASFSPRSRPSDWAIIPRFVAACLGLSAVLAVVSVRQVRRVAARGPGEPSRRPRTRSRSRSRSRSSLGRELRSGWTSVLSRLPGPALDLNPVLWREWHRNRPSRGSRWTWGLFIAGSALFTFIALYNDVATGNGGPGVRVGATSLWVNGLQVAIGLLLLSVGASTSLAEERARGSLDILMTTPMSTPAIVWGKWLGTFRGALGVALLPSFLGLCLAWHSGRWLGLPVLIALILAYGAFITSLGLALATWIPRLGRAVAVSVFAHVLTTVGSFFLILTLVRSPADERLLVLGPFGGPAIMTIEIANSGSFPVNRDWSRVSTVLDFVAAFGWELVAIFLYTTGAIVLFTATLATFDRCLGRASAGRPS